MSLQNFLMKPSNLRGLSIPLCSLNGAVDMYIRGDREQMAHPEGNRIFLRISGPVPLHL